MLYEGCVDAGRAPALTMEGEKKMHAKEKPERPKCSVVRPGRSCVSCLFCRTNRARGISPSSSIVGDA
jgi:hypothetical protein